MRNQPRERAFINCMRFNTHNLEAQPCKLVSWLLWKPPPALLLPLENIIVILLPVHFQKGDHCPFSSRGQKSSARPPVISSNQVLLTFGPVHMLFPLSWMQFPAFCKAGSFPHSGTSSERPSLTWCKLNPHPIIVPFSNLFPSKKADSMSLLCVLSAQHDRTHSRCSKGVC